MTPIYDKHIDHPMAWRGSEIRSKDDFARDLTGRQQAALLEVLARVQGIPRNDIRREHCGHPDLDAELEKVFNEIQHGRGVVVLRGAPIGGLSVDDIEKMYWVLGTHLGEALSHNSIGVRMTRVQEERLKDGTQTARGTKSRAELAMHCDSTDILGLMCVRPARSGGETQFSSVLAVHNDILATRPDILPILYRGFPHHRRGEQPDGMPMVTPYDIPIFCNVDGYISSYIAFGSIYAGLQALGRTPTEQEQEALDILQDTMIRLQFNLSWEAGDICFANNLAMFHSRSDYVDWDEPEKRRLLLRYWLEPTRDRRPVVPQIHLHENKGQRNGVDPVPGRTIAANEYVEMPPDVIEAIKRGQKKRGFAHPS